MPAAGEAHQLVQRHDLLSERRRRVRIAASSANARMLLALSAI